MKESGNGNSLGGSKIAREAAPFTTAMVGIGNVGSRYATNIVLQFQAELAVANDAVAAELHPNWGEELGFLTVQSQVADHAQYLLRPDLGRKLSRHSVKKIKNNAAKDIDVQIILADGLSASACSKTGPRIYQFLNREFGRLNVQTGTPIVAKYARVWLQDEIGALTGAKVAVIILGERPGLGTGDGLSAYMVFEPQAGKTDSDRNMISNIHERGIKPDQAAERLAQLALAMLEQKTSGVQLDLGSIKAEGILDDSALRTPQPRTPLVELD